MTKARKYVVKNYFNGIPKLDFEVVEYKLPPSKDIEILLKLLSVDPYQRAYNFLYQVPYDHFGFQVGVVHESMDPKFPIGMKVVTHKGWNDYTIAKDGVLSGPVGILECVRTLIDIRVGT